MKNIKDYKNIVFDMGHVVCEYDSRRSIARFTSDERVISEIRWVVYNSAPWQMLDAGLDTEENAFPRLLSRLSSDEVREIARKSLIDYEEVNLWPKAGMDEVITALKARGQRIYILSNASLRLAGCWKSHFPCPDLFDGLLFSAQVKCIKPQKEIYQIFFDRFGLDPADCFFIDDLQRNIDAARACGMEGWTFRSGDVGELKKVLEL